MDVVYKGIALVWVQVASVASMVQALPGIAWRLALRLRAPPEDERGVVFYEGCVKHIRRSPVINAFECVAGACALLSAG